MNMGKGISEVLEELRIKSNESDKSKECYENFIAKLDHNRRYLESEKNDDAVFYVFKNGNLVETTTNRERERVEREEELKKRK
jgi:hypothetical protein